MHVVFWLSVFGVFYPYFGYPLVLVLLRRVTSRRPATDPAAPLPGVTIIVPVHNEASRIAAKVRNTAALRYPDGFLEVLFVSDGSTDRTVDIVREQANSSMAVVELPVRGGKAAALNAGLRRAAHDVIIFSDASIMLEPGAVEAIVRPLADPAIGCVSGEDRIADTGGEGLYGRYELALRRLESDVHSIVGASGSFYAQRRSLCQPFTEGLAPDFLSVLRTVEQGFRAIAEPSAVGSMTSVEDPKHEFERKVRTLIRGLTTLFAHVRLLNPVRYGWFAFMLFSHKVLRWTAPLFMLGAFLAALALADSTLYLSALGAQLAFYVSAAAAFGQWAGVHRTSPGRVALYFVSSNMAILVAWLKYARGVRQEIWTPSRR
jgi:cellulose synthase/poly-beta-1,6-N-acetylglucosamine synthase-like glycosyltransferase